MIIKSQGEQPLPPGGSCVLSAVNLSKYVLNPFTENAEFDYKSLEEDLYYIYGAMNDVVNEVTEKHVLEKQREIARKWRNIGIGTAGWGDMFIKFCTPYGSEKSKSLANDVAKFMFNTCLKYNIEYGKRDGNFPEFNNIVAPHITNTSIYYNNECNSSEADKYLRNCSMLTVAPTGSIAILLGCSGGIEPEFALSYTRRTVSLNNKEQLHEINAEIVDEYWTLHPEDKKEKMLPLYFVTAYDINYADRIQIQGIIQKSIDSAISSTVNLPQDISIEEVEQLYLKAWAYGLKGVTVYREGSRDPILFVNREDRKNTSEVKKRPKDIESNLYKITVNGEKFAVIVGLLDDEPYEVFAFKIPEDRIDIIEAKGITTKVKKGVFKFKSDNYEIENLNDYYGNIEERATTLYVSMLLRHHADIKFIVKTAKKVNPVISSFTSAICRILNKNFTNDDSEESYEICPECGGKIMKHAGCKECTNCGYSVCNLMIRKKE